MVRKYFGTDGIRGRANAVITPELALKVGQAAGLIFRNGEHRNRVLDRQGHAALRLHDRDRHGRRLHIGRHGCAANRPDADAGRRHAHALDARRPRRDDLGFAQPVRRQRHQALRSGWLQALGRDRAPDRKTGRRRTRQAAGQAGRARPRQADRRRAGPLHRVRQAHPAAQPVLRGTADRGRLRQWRCLPGGSRRALGARRRGDLRSGSSPTASTSTRNVARPIPRCFAARCARCAPTPASRSTATPIVSSSSTSAATWSTATSSWR